MIHAYPCELATDDDGTLVVTFPDVPEAITGGQDRTEAIRLAADALAVALAGYVHDQRDIPEPSTDFDDTPQDVIDSFYEGENDDELFGPSISRFSLATPGSEPTTFAWSRPDGRSLRASEHPEVEFVAIGGSAGAGRPPNECGRRPAA